MKAPTLIGILLIALGIVALAYQGITYTTREKVLDIESSAYTVRGPWTSSGHREQSLTSSL